LLLFVCCVLVVVYSLTWIGVSSKVKDYAEAQLEAMKQPDFSQKYGISDVSYESLEVSGFPFDFKVNVEKPSFKIDYNHLIQKQLAKYDIELTEHAVEQFMMNGFDVWIDQHSFNGTLTFSKSGFGETYVLEMGPGTLTSVTDLGQKKVKVNTVYEQPSTLSVQFKGWSILPSFDLESKEVDKRIAKFQALNFDSGRIYSENADSKEKMSSVEASKMSMTLSDYGKSGKKKFSFKVDVDDLQFFEGIMDYFYNNKHLKQWSRHNAIDFLNYVKRGKINIDTEISYKGTTNSSDFATNSYMIDLDIKSLDWKDEAVKFSSSGSLNVSATKSTIPNITFKYASSQEVSPLGYDVALSNLQLFMEELALEPSVASNRYFQMFEVLVQDEPNLLVPDMHKFGVMNTKIDFSFFVDDKGQMSLQIGGIGMSNDVFSVNLYGSGSGNMLQAKGEGALNLEIKNFETMYGYLRNYIVHIQNYMVDPRRNWQLDYVFTAEIFEAIKKTVLRLSNYAEVQNGELVHTNPNVLITINFPKESMPTIGTLSLPEAQQFLMSYLFPYIEKGFVR
ncbi:MAG: hypothetical protein MK137_05510, partial [Rickettsiales bacterium]|nr:hypothetical protein [Rickettsiales bacterium]